jgi:hypothetical protein
VAGEKLAEFGKRCTIAGALEHAHAQRSLPTRRRWSTAPAATRPAPPPRG